MRTVNETVWNTTGPAVAGPATFRTLSVEDDVESDAARAFEIDPLFDPRWAALVDSHTRASVFHSPNWLQALRTVYGYIPFVVTTCPPGTRLTNGLVFCRVKSWLTGRRLVSLPFSDHCEPLVDSVEDQDILTAALERELGRGGYRYFEIRPLEPLGLVTPLRHSTATYAFHQLDLRSSLDAIFRNFHKSSTQRKIQ